MKQVKEFVAFIKALGGDSINRKIVLSVKILLVVFLSLISVRKKVFLDLSFNKVKFSFYIYDRIDISILNEVFVTKEYKHDMISKCTEILDLGANIGAVSVYLAIKYPEASITSIEANPNIFKQLKENTESFQNILCKNLAISDKENENLTFYVHSSHLGSSLIKEKGGVPTNILSTSLQSLIKKIGKFDLIKFDVEGAEGKIFTKNPREFAKHYIGEVHYDLIDESREKFLNRFKDFSVKKTRLKKDRDLIFAEAVS